MENKKNKPPQINPLRAEVLEKSFSELEGFIEEKSQEIFSIEKTSSIEAVFEDIDAETNNDLESEEDEQENFNIEYDSEELDIEEYDKNDFQEEKDTSDIERDFVTEEIINVKDVELEIIETPQNTFYVNVNTKEVSKKFTLNRTIDHKINNAGKVVIEALKEREKLLEDIGDFIVKELESYLKNLSDNKRHWYLKPLKMKDIKGKGHLSTISRIIKDTLVSLPNGEIVELKSFFDKTELPIHTYALAIEIKSLLQSNKKITYEKICELIKQEALMYKIDFNNRLKKETIKHIIKKYKIEKARSKK